MRSLVSWSARFRVLALGAALAVMIVGVVQLPSASVDTLPEFAPPYVEIQTEALGLSAEEVEQLVTAPLESKLLAGVAFVESMESRSVQGLSSILLTFEPGTDPIRGRQMVAERLTQANILPNVSRPPVMLQPLSSENRLMMVSLASEDLSLIELSVLARWTIGPRLMGVPGVANVAIWGQRERQLQVLVDPERLRDAGVTLDEVVRTTGNALWVSPLTYLRASTPGTGGFIDTPNQRLNVQHVFPIDTADDLGRVAIEATDPTDARLRLADVADVVEDHQPMIGDAVVNDEPGLLLVVEKFPAASTLNVSAGVEAALHAMAPGLEGVEVDSSVFRPASYLESAMTNVALAAVLGLLLLSFVAVALLADWRAAIVSLVAVVLSLTVGALVLHVAGSTINTLVVGGFAAAVLIVVDDAVLSAHTAVRRPRLDELNSGDTPTDALVQAVMGTRVPMVYATAAIVLASIPFFLLGGTSGALLPSALLAFLVAIVASMVTAIVVGPALMGWVANRARPAESPIVARVQLGYGRSVGWMLSRPRQVLSAFGVAAIGAAILFAVAIVPVMDRSPVPALVQRDLLIQFDGAAGTSRTEMNRVVASATRELRAIEGVRNVGAHVGRAVASDQVVGINSGEIWVSIGADADYAATMSSIENAVDGYPGIARAVTTHGEERMDRVFDPAAADITVRIFGSELESMRASAATVRDAVAGIDGVATAFVASPVDEPAIDVEVDVDAAAEHGLRPGDVRRAAAIMLSGIEVGSLFEDQKVFEVLVVGAADHRQSLSGVEDLLIETPAGELVPLGEIADVRVTSSPTVLHRAAVQGALDVGVMVSGRDLGAVLADVESAIISVAFPLESHAEVLEYTAAGLSARTTLMLTVAGAMAGIYLLLQAAVGSWTLAGMMMLALSAAAIGGLLAALGMGEDAAIGSTIGLLAVFGFAIRSMLRQVSHHRQLQAQPGEGRSQSAVMRGAREQLAPTLISALATAAAVLPAAVLGGREGLEVIRAVAYVVLGGLVSTTLMNLFVVPVLVHLFGPTSEPEMVAVAIEPTRETQAVGA